MNDDSAQALLDACTLLGNTQNVREIVQMVYRLGFIDGELSGVQKCVQKVVEAGS